MKRIGIDARLIFQTGVGRYTQNLLHYIQRHLAQDEELYVYVLNEDFNNLPISHPRVHLRKAQFMWHTLAEQLGFGLQLLRDNLDLMHFTYFSFPILYRKPFVITIHDLIPLKHMTGKASTKNALMYTIKHAGYRRALSAGVNSSAAIITPTETVKKEILEHYPHIDADKIKVTYEGLGSQLLHQKPGPNPPYNQRYCLYVGNFYPHKNIIRLIEAWALLKEDIHLVLVGPQDYFAQIVQNAIHEHSQENRISMVHGLTDKDLVTHYAHAEALVHPSLDEGFGLPLLEASYFGCPVIASDIPLFHETLGEHFTAFDPLDIYDIASKVSGFLEKPSKKTLTQKAISTRFSFEQMAHQTYDIYQAVLSGSSA